MLNHFGDPVGIAVVYSAIALFFLSYVIEIAIGTCHRGYVVLTPKVCAIWV